MANSTYTNFLKSPDQAARSAELRAFIGPHPAKFLKTYENQVALATRPKGGAAPFSLFSRAFLWPALFLGPIWFFYRKMWTWAIGLTVLGIALGFLPIARGAGVGIAAASGAAGALLYLNHAISKIEALRAKQAGDELNLAEVAAAGGVSRAAGWISGAVYTALIAATLVLTIPRGTPATTSPDSTQPTSAR